MDVIISLDDEIEIDEVKNLYALNNWSSAENPDVLIKALRNSDSLVTARISGVLLGIGNAISDGFLVVYYPHLLVHPDHQGKGIGKAMMQALKIKYSDFHQQMLSADEKAVKFYESCGFKKAGRTQSMWVYEGKEH